MWVSGVPAATPRVSLRGPGHRFCAPRHSAACKVSELPALGGESSARGITAVTTGLAREGPGRSPAPPRQRRGDVVLEATLLLVFGLALARLLTRGLLRVPLVWPAPWGWSLHLAVVFLLLVWRVFRGRRAGEPSSPRLGRWFAGCREPELILLAALLSAFWVLSPPFGILGADAAVYLQQLRDVLLRGEFRNWTGVEPGTVLVWAPFFLIGHLWAQMGLGRDIAVAPQGLSHAYRAAMAVSGPVYGFLCVLFAHRVCRRFFPSMLAAVCLVGAWFASSLYYYSVAEPIMPHAPGAALASLLLLLWIRAREAPERLGRWIAASAAGGLLVALQRYDVYLLLPLVWDGMRAAHRQWRSATDRRVLITRAAALVGVFLLAVSPLLMLAASTPHGLLSLDSVRTVGVGEWKHPHVLETLYSSRGGLFVWTPWALGAVLGLVTFARRERAVGGVLVITIASGILLLATSPQWTGGWSFGSRRLTEAFPVLALGFCSFAAVVLRRPWILGLAALALLAGVNVSVAHLVANGRVPQGTTVRFMDVGRGVIEEAYTALGHPPAWPVNWIFAARHGVSPDRFDDLYAGPPSTRVHVQPGSDEAPSVLVTGWTTVREPTLSIWATGVEARMLVRLAPSSTGWRLSGRRSRGGGSERQGSVGRRGGERPRRGKVFARRRADPLDPGRACYVVEQRAQRRSLQSRLDSRARPRCSP